MQHVVVLNISVLLKSPRLTFFFCPSSPSFLLMDLILRLSHYADALFPGVGHHYRPHTLCHELALCCGVPGVMHMAKTECLKCRDGHIQSTFLHKDSSNLLDEMTEISTRSHMHRADDSHHKNELSGSRVQIEGTPVNKRECRGRASPVCLQSFDNPR